jgi:hypothetical protein
MNKEITLSADNQLICRAQELDVVMQSLDQAQPVTALSRAEMNER